MNGMTTVTSVQSILKV